MTTLGGIATPTAKSDGDFDWRPSAWQPAHIMAIAAAATPTLGALSPLGLAPLYAIAGVFAIGLHILRRRTAPLPGVAMLLALGTLFGWCALGLIWTTVWPETLRFLPRLALDLAGALGLVGALAAVNAEGRRAIERALLGGFVVGCVLMAIELLTHGAIVNGIRSLWGGATVVTGGELNRGAAIFALFAFPAAIAARRIYGWGAVVILLAASLALTHAAEGSKAALAVAFGALAWAGALALRQRAAHILAVAAIIVLATAPLLPTVMRAVPGPWTTSTNPSVTHRVLIWNFVADRISERPLLGWGLNSSRAIPGGKDGPMPGTENLPLHPHNGYLQVWLEMGAVGAGIVGAMLALAIMSARRRFGDDWSEYGLALGAITAALTCAGVGYGLFQGWWLSTFVLLAATLMSLGKSESAPRA